MKWTVLYMIVMNLKLNTTMLEGTMIRWSMTGEVLEHAMVSTQAPHISSATRVEALEHWHWSACGDAREKVKAC